MKKFLLSSIIIASGFTFAYTSIDVSNAEFLANRGVINKQSDVKNYRLNDTISRAELIKIALTIKGTANPASYTCKKYFSDTTANDWICRAIEIAADAWFVSRTNKKFRPQDKITRAEALSVLMKAGWISINDISDYSHGTEGVMSDAQIWWQAEIFNIGYSLNIIDKSSLRTEPLAGEMWGLKYYFYPNRSATRSEVFAFTKKILSYKKNITETIVKIENGNVVVYRNWGAAEQLTTDGSKNIATNCVHPDSFNTYSILGKVGEVYVIKHIFGLCETDAGWSQTLAFIWTLIDLQKMVKEKFGIVVWGERIKVSGGKIVISGEFDSIGECEGLGCPIYLPTEKIAALGIRVIKQPTDIIPWEFEFVVNENILFH